jgi:hypothetical protein
MKARLSKMEVTYRQRNEVWQLPPPKNLKQPMSAQNLTSNAIFQAMATPNILVLII